VTSSRYDAALATAPHRHIDPGAGAPDTIPRWSGVDWAGGAIATVRIGRADGAASETLQAAPTHGALIGLPRPRVHDAGYLASRVSEEVSRYDHYGQPFALVALCRAALRGAPWLAEASVDVVQALCLRKQPSDMFAWLSAGTLILLMPHTGVTGARREIDRLRQELAGVAEGWTLSALVYPADARTIEGLPFDQ